MQSKQENNLTPIMLHCSINAIFTIISKRQFIVTKNEFITFFVFFDLILYHTGQCTRTGGCYNELVMATFRTGAGIKGKKSIPVDFMIYL